MYNIKCLYIIFFLLFIMNNPTKIYIIIAILILSFLITINDIAKHYLFDTYNKISSEKQALYKKLKIFKKLLIVFIAILSVILLQNIKFNIKIYLFLIILFLNIAIDYIFIVDDNSTKFEILMDRYVSLYLDIFLNVIICFILYKLVN